MADLHEYLIDVKMFASIRVRATSDRDAKDKLRAAIAECDANLGILDGEPIVCEPVVEAMDVLEIDGVDQ